MAHYSFPHHIKIQWRKREAGKAERREETGNCRISPHIFYIRALHTHAKCSFECNTLYQLDIYFVYTIIERNLFIRPMFTSASPTVIRRFCAIAIEDDRNEYSRAFAHVKLGDRLSERSRNHRTLIFLARYFFRRRGKKGKIPGGKREGRREALSQLIKRRIDR